MNVSESKQFQIALRYLLGLPLGPGVPQGAEVEQEAERAGRALAWFADRAREAGAGLSGEDVQRKWAGVARALEVRHEG